jgi:hypothetical protein
VSFSNGIITIQRIAGEGFDNDLRIEIREPVEHPLSSRRKSTTAQPRLPPKQTHEEVPVSARRPSIVRAGQLAIVRTSARKQLNRFPQIPVHHIQIAFD